MNKKILFSYYATFLRTNYLKYTFKYLKVQGFTLIELLVVFSLMAMLTSLGIASYSSFNSSQIVSSNALNVATQLNSAKSQAISQVIPSSCGTNTLTGYEVDMTVTGQQYTVSAVCGTKQVVSLNKLPPQLSFATGSTASVFYNIGTGNIVTPATINIQGGGKAEAILDNSQGIISINQTGVVINTPIPTSIQVVATPTPISVPISLPVITQSNTPTPTSSLIFDDEFNGAAGSAPVSTKWSILGGTNPSKWGVECFVNDRTHIYLDGNGHLVETATYNPGGVPCTNGSGLYESGGMTTGSAVGGLFDFTYGTAVASIKVPCQSGLGIWPAWWADGNNWPQGGEVDYLEVMQGYNGTNAEQSLHGPSTSSSSWNLGNTNIASTQWCNQYHTYGAIWSPGSIKFTIDGTVTHTDTPGNMQSGWTWPFDTSGTNSERLLLDLQVGSWGGTINNATFPQSMLVDYVRVYASN